ncbi:AMP-binding protein [Legionella feeleii]|uniref:Non-ribosomal peptide synthetase/polyketide synthetase n=1 Tax=Legionella feeleii TaxID=453 RepID=A0A378IZG9_9GAMM|nr:AMP-binding protein [Legionella feeleii]STX39945.1 non-ribosomal peptide synthetase/polyketide synthetase [Legionella feeleii]
MNYYNLGLAFTEIVASHTTQPALYYAEEQYTYVDLLGWAERLGALLLSKGIQRGDVIAIGNNKRPLSYALMIAALRLGIVYVNIDTASPLSRNANILKVSGASLLFYDDSQYESEMKNLAKEHQCPSLLLETTILPAVSQIDREQQQLLMNVVDGACIAYIMFTSGSTGIPKGVAVTHQNVLHFISWGQNYFQISPQDNFANLSPMYFDNSVFDFYVGLFSGASLSPIRREFLTKPYELVEYVQKMQCSIWFSVPSLIIYLMAMKAIAKAALPQLRCIIFGGEGYPKVELKKLYDLFSMRAQLVNVYGPTECTCICSAYQLSDNDFRDMDGLPPLGKLNCNFDYLILNEYQEKSHEGELCLIGPNVASGYFNDLERSAASFITLTEPRYFMKRMYRTGDLVQERDGILYFIGRKDNQIKHMGYRIELEEIEQALVKLPYVNQAAVVYQRTNSAYGKLIGFVACLDVIAEKDVLVDLAKLLPEYMIPSRIFVSEELRKNTNGKVDRQRLLAQVLEY